MHWEKANFLAGTSLNCLPNHGVNILNAILIKNYEHQVVYVNVELVNLKMHYYIVSWCKILWMKVYVAIKP